MACWWEASWRFSWARRCLLGLQPVGVVALVGNAAAPVQFQDPAGGVVEEIAVVGDGHHGAGEVVQEALQPGHALGVEVVGGLVQQDHVGVGQQQAAQGDPAALTAGQGGHVRVPGRQAQGVGGHFQLVVEIVGVGGLDNVLQPRLLPGQGVEIRIRLGVVRVDFLQAGEGIDRLLQALLHVAAHVLVRVQLGLLGQVADLDAGLGPGLAEDIGVDPRHDPQQGGFARAVQAQHTDLGAGEEGQGDIFQDGFLGRHNLANPIHGVDVLGHCSTREGKTTSRGF